MNQEIQSSEARHMYLGSQSRQLFWKKMNRNILLGMGSCHPEVPHFLHSCIHGPTVMPAPSSLDEPSISPLRL